MNKTKFVKLYKDRGYDDKAIDAGLQVLNEAHNYFKNKGSSIDTASIDDAKTYIKYLMDNNKNSLDNLLALARYFYIIKQNNIYIYFTKILGGLGVLENIKKRVKTFTDNETANRIFKHFENPPLGTPLEDMPRYTQNLMKRIKSNLNEDIYQKILAGNNHGISPESMQAEKEFYNNSDSLDTYLQVRHQRKVEELQSYCDSNTVWFEQIITQDIVDFVASNQEILSAKREGNKLYVTKIPYDTVNYLKEENPRKKSYYACHCPFARESIMSSGNNIDSDWCYCSGGFAKFPFEEILGRKLNVKLINSALAGDSLCRFKIDLGEIIDEF